MTNLELWTRTRKVDWLFIGMKSHVITMLGPDGKNWQVSVRHPFDKWLIDDIVDEKYDGEVDFNSRLAGFFQAQLEAEFADYLDCADDDPDTCFEEQPQWSSKREEVI